MRTSVRQTCIPPRSLIILHHHLDSIYRWAKPLLGSTTWAFQVGALPTSECKLLQALALLHYRLPVVKPHRFPGRDQSGSSWEATQISGEADVYPGKPFWNGGTTGSGETSWHGAVVAAEGGMQSICSHTSNAVCLGLLSMSIVISFSCEGERSQEWPMLPSWWRYCPHCFICTAYFNF